MREIKFRQWMGDNFAYWGFVKGATFASPASSNAFGGLNAANTQQMQFTGLQDKSGADIYEGDIFLLHRGDGYHAYDVDDPNISLRVVGFSDDDACFGLFWVNMEKQTSGLTFCKANAASCFEVIGNIHENPELLED